MLSAAFYTFFVQEFHGGTCLHVLAIGILFTPALNAGVIAAYFGIL
jgi:hypothetical protein